MAKTELLAVYDFERYRFENEEGDHLIADAFDEDGKLVTIKGDEISSGFKRGISYRFFGRWTTYRDQKQFAFTSAVQCAPFGRKGVVKYLQLAHKLGKATAENIWDAYGSESLKMIREGDEGEFLEATGVRRELFREWRAYFLRHHAMESCVVDLTNILDGQGLPKKIIGHCIEMWGAQAAEVVKQNPYKLMQFRGVGFSRCDRMYLSFGHRPDSLRRQALCAWYGIAQRHQDGHTWVPEAIAQSTLRGMIGGATVNEEKALRLALRGGLLESMYTENGELHWFGDTRWLADKQKSKAERRLARCIVEARRDPSGIRLDYDIEGLSDHQLEVYDSIRSQYGCIRILGGGPGTGKAQPLDAKLLTDTGWRRMGDIKVGDSVYTQSGKLTQVTGVYPQGLKPVYKVLMSDGSRTRCCDEHLWFTTTRNDRKRSRPYSVRTLAQIRQTLYRSDNGGLNHKIPLVEPVEFPTRKQAIDPYVMAVLLAEGSLTCKTVTFTNQDIEIVEEVKARIPEDLKLSERDGYSYGISSSGPSNSIKDSLRDYQLWGKKSVEKHIPEDYLMGDVEQRMLLLQGLLDCEAHVDGVNIEFTTSSEAMADDFLFLANSLGVVCTMSTRIPSFTYEGEKREGHVSFRIMVRPPSWMVPFRLPRKREAYTPRTKYPASRFIKLVELVGTQLCQCISVADESSLYVTDDFIVTHNTHTLAAVVKSILPEVGQDQIAIAAPTGKAAVRITEGLAGHGIPIRATTIHSLLGFSPSGFRHGADYPLPHSFIIIDESSMLDTGLCNSLMQARGRNTSMLFIGDVNQLPPVGHGAPLRDMIASGLVPYGELTEVRRNSGEIVRQCENIRDNGTMLVRSSDDPRYDDENIELVHGSDDKSKIRAMLNLLTLDRKPGANPVWDYQVLVPTNKSGDLGRKALNKVLQSRLNRHKPVPASPFRLRDKVVCLKNGFFRCLEADDLAPRNQSGDVYVANGDIGEVIECEPAKMVIKLASPHRVIVTGRSTKQREDVREDDMDAMLKTAEDTGTGCSFDLAYALSVHKAQGSESPYVIVMLDDSGGAARICSREWIYTAISRAKKHCYLVGSLQTAEGMCRVQKVGERKTFLAEQIHRVMETEPEEVEASVPLPAVSSIEQEFSEL